MLQRHSVSSCSCERPGFDSETWAIAILLIGMTSEISPQLFNKSILTIEETKKWKRVFRLSKICPENIYFSAKSSENSQSRRGCFLVYLVIERSMLPFQLRPISLGEPAVLICFLLEMLVKCSRLSAAWYKSVLLLANMFQDTYFTRVCI